MKQVTIQQLETIFRDRKPGPQGTYKYYSVLVPLIEQNGELYLLFEVRSDELKIQPGEVCFPGGRMEEGESPEDCVIRETCEELNILPEEIRLLGQLDYILSYSNFTMYPFLGVISLETYQKMVPNKDEVKEVFLVPLEYFLQEEPLLYTYEVYPHGIEQFPYDKINSKDGYKWRKGKTTIPIYEYPEWTIWGLTALITHHLIGILKTHTGKALVLDKLFTS